MTLGGACKGGDDDGASTTTTLTDASAAQVAFARRTIEPVLLLHVAMRSETTTEQELRSFGQRFEALLNELASFTPTEGDLMATLGSALAEYSGFVRRVAPIGPNARRQMGVELTPIAVRWIDAMRAVERASKSQILNQFDLSPLGQIAAEGSAPTTTLAPPNLDRTTTTGPRPPAGFATTTTVPPPPPGLSP